MFNLFKAISEWYEAYPSAWVFAYHKFTHIVVGGLIGAVGMFAGYPIIGMLIVLGVAIAKEVSDRQSSYDFAANSYQYDAPLASHILDVIVTTLGGLLGVLVVGVF